MNVSWILKTAWRDTRGSRSRLLLFISSITLGITALTAIGAFGENLRRSIDEQAKTLLGADLVIRGSRPFSSEDEEFFAGIASLETARQISTATMAYFPAREQTRLVQVRALSGAFPFYGKLETAPASAAQDFRKGDFALVDEGLMVQLDVEVGDEVRIGEKSLRVAGRLRSMPGEAPVANMSGPRVYIPYAAMQETGLVQLGSRIGYRIFYRLADDTDAEALEEEIRPRLEAARLRSETVADRKENVGEALENLYKFLELSAFTALLLGGIGVAAGIHFHLRRKTPVVAVLRCLGATARQTFAVYLLQAGLLGLVGTVTGGLIGLALQLLVPRLVSDFLPIEVEARLSWTAALEGMAIGLALTVLFALIPLLPIRRIPPLLTLRKDFEESEKGPRDPLQWAAIASVFVLITLWSVQRSGEWAVGLGYCLGLVVILLLLSLTARTLAWLARRLASTTWSFVWRQGLANLHRPQNQTGLLLPVLGLGTLLILVLYLVQTGLMDQVRSLSAENSPNLILFDIQTDQVDGVDSIVRDHELPVLQRVPIVTMRIASLKGREVQEILSSDEARKPPRWAVVREYRSTYRDRPNSAEEVIEGKWIGRIDEGFESTPLSLEEGIAQTLGLKVGDELVVDVQGFPIKAYVANLRRLEWRRFQPGFFMVFPEGVLEAAPQFHVLVTRVDDPVLSGRLQRDVVANYPNVSAIDLNLILQTVDDILSKAAFVIRFMALFSVLTGLVVLAGAVAAGRYQRMRESVLLRTLGASRRQVRVILFAEYLFLGLFAALSGTCLALLAGWAVSAWVFEVDFEMPVAPPLLALVISAALTVLIGMLNSRGLLNRPPLEVLRSEE